MRLRFLSLSLSLAKEIMCFFASRTLYKELFVLSGGVRAQRQLLMCSSYINVKTLNTLVEAGIESGIKFYESQDPLKFS